MPKWAALVCALLCVLPAWAGDEPVQLTMHYHQRVPYLVMAESGMRGLTGTPARRALDAAKIPSVWVETPDKRLLHIIEANTGMDCGVGWFRNPGRERFARFSTPLFQDRPFEALLRADNARIGASPALKGLMRDSTLTLLLKAGYSYGQYLDEAIRRYGPRHREVTGDNLIMLKMVHKGRADYMFISPDEADGLIQFSGLPPSDFRTISFPDIPYGETRHIMCSMQVPQQIIDRLNKVIPPLPAH